LDIIFAVLETSAQHHTDLSTKYPFLRSHVFFGLDQVTPENVEKMVPQYFTFLQNLYVNKGITEVEVGRFFKGCFMDSEFSQEMLSLGKVPMKFYMSKHTTLPKLTDVVVNDIPVQHVNVIKQVSTIWVGKQCGEYDFCMFFENFLIKGEIKITTVGKQISLSGKSGDTFSSEMKKAVTGPTAVKERKIGFLFVTNGKMTEKKAESIVKPCGMFVNSQRWKSTFTDALWFFTYVNDNDGEDIDDEEEQEEGEQEEQEQEQEDEQAEEDEEVQKPASKLTTTGKRRRNSDDEGEDQPKKKKQKKDEGPPYTCPYCKKEYEKRYDYYEAHVNGHEL